MMTNWFYLTGLLVAIGCMLLIDRRLKLAFWNDHKRTTLTLLTAIILFIIWDILGISFSIFFDGASQFMLPIRLFPHFPIEEVFFLFLLSYTTLIVYTGASKRR